MSKKRNGTATDDWRYDVNENKHHFIHLLSASKLTPERQATYILYHLRIYDDRQLPISRFMRIK